VRDNVQEIDSVTGIIRCRNNMGIFIGTSIEGDMDIVVVVDKSDVLGSSSYTSAILIVRIPTIE